MQQETPAVVPAPSFLWIGPNYEGETASSNSEGWQSNWSLDGHKPFNCVQNAGLEAWHCLSDWQTALTCQIVRISRPADPSA
ncbi:predicted protein [Botrytis cinerea T4]|uniref:Uncharacterized protein n=1 Tax=Botryotinia fuckeliana (strain T4) TaxID=999810 RepID=G2YHF9_BOTF4|nr:predicted protein [Botrytis cinerea T4]